MNTVLSKSVLQNCNSLSLGKGAIRSKQEVEEEEGIRIDYILVAASKLKNFVASTSPLLLWLLLGIRLFLCLLFSKSKKSCKLLAEISIFIDIALHATGQSFHPG